MSKTKLYGIIISNKKEQNELISLIREYKIKIVSEELLNSNKIHHLWCYADNEIGLGGTQIFAHLEKSNIFNNVNEFKKYLEING